MFIVTRMVSAVVAASAVCAAARAFLQWQGMSGLALFALAVVGALLSIAMWQRLWDGVLTGVASIAGGTLGAVVAVELLQLNIRMVPFAVFSGAVCGGAIWVIAATAPVSEKWAVFGSRGRSRLRSEASKPKHREAYLVVGLGAMIGGPVLGGVFYGLYCAAFDVDPMDRFLYLSYHTIVGTVAGLLVGLPYLLVWLTRIADAKR